MLLELAKALSAGCLSIGDKEHHIDKATVAEDKGHVSASRQAVGGPAMTAHCQLASAADRDQSHLQKRGHVSIATVTLRLKSGRYACSQLTRAHADTAAAHNRAAEQGLPGLQLPVHTVEGHAGSKRDATSSLMPAIKNISVTLLG